ncbi:hypothetical protein HGA88_03855 [Candidatus Roizmanbacteria bacterium]|nr:hypothetical protein [Candidatus Roizmanbacteria bacterium]
MKESDVHPKKDLQSKLPNFYQGLTVKIPDAFLAPEYNEWPASIEGTFKQVEKTMGTFSGSHQQATNLVGKAVLQHLVNTHKLHHPWGNTEISDTRHAHLIKDLSNWWSSSAAQDPTIMPVTYELMENIGLTGGKPVADMVFRLFAYRSDRELLDCQLMAALAEKNFQYSSDNSTDRILHRLVALFADQAEEMSGKRETCAYAFGHLSNLPHVQEFLASTEGIRLGQLSSKSWYLRVVKNSDVLMEPERQLINKALDPDLDEITHFQANSVTILKDSYQEFLTNSDLG